MTYNMVLHAWCPNLKVSVCHGPYLVSSVYIFTNKAQNEAFWCSWTPPVLFKVENLKQGPLMAQWVGNSRHSCVEIVWADVESEGHSLEKEFSQAPKGKNLHCVVTRTQHTFADYIWSGFIFSHPRCRAALIIAPRWWSSLRRRKNASFSHLSRCIFIAQQAATAAFMWYLGLYSIQ